MHIFRGQGKRTARRIIIFGLFLWSLLWLWRDQLYLPIALDGWLVCTAILLGFSLFFLQDKREAGDTGIEGTGFAGCAFIFIFLVVLPARAVWATNHFGNGEYPVRFSWCIAGWLFLALFLYLVRSASAPSIDAETHSNIDDKMGNS